MKILAIEKEIVTEGWDDRRELLAAEARSVYELYLSDTLREIYFNERHEAVLILECTDRAAAEEVLGRLPLVKASLINFELMELRPYNGYSRIIS